MMFDDEFVSIQGTVEVDLSLCVFRSIKQCKHVVHYITLLDRSTSFEVGNDYMSSKRQLPSNGLELVTAMYTGAAVQ